MIEGIYHNHSRKTDGKGFTRKDGKMGKGKSEMNFKFCIRFVGKLLS